MSDDDWNFDYPKIARDSGFKFHQYNDGNIDWRQIGGIDVEKILQNQNIEKLDSVIIHLAEVPLCPLLNSNVLESGVAKYFLLSQLAIQYLIFCKRFLDETVTSMRSTVRDLQSENMRFRKLEQEHADDVLQLHKELQKLRNISEVIFPCSMCTKNFVSNEMLNVHILRKHSNELQRSSANSTEKRAEKQNDKQLISTIKLELEIKHLKERLNDAEKIIRNQTFEITKQIEEIKGTPRIVQSSPAAEDKEKIATKITVATQNEVISVKNIGIQSNLVEDKEKDDIDTMEKNQILEIFKKINEKINQIEKFRDDDLKLREATLLEFENKLQSVTEAIEEKQQHNLEILNKFSDKMSSSQTSLNPEINLDELKTFLNDAMEKIQNENKRQLHQLAEKFDQTYLDKLNSLKANVDKVSTIEKKDPATDLKDIINKSKEIAQRLTNRSETERSIAKNEPSTSKSQPEIVKVGQKVQKPIIAKTKFISKEEDTISSVSSRSSESTSDGSETEGSDSTSYDDKGIDDKTNRVYRTRSVDALKLPSKNNNVTTRVGSESSLKTEPAKLKESPTIVVPALNLKQPTHNIPKIVRKMQETRLRSIGVSPNAKSIATSSMVQIDKNLANIRKTQKRLFPKFTATRNHLKSIVDKMVQSKTANQEKTLKVKITKSKKQSNLAISENTPSGKLNVVTSESETESSSSPKSISNNAEKIEKQETSSSMQNRDEFKSKLEKILSSPMQKLNKTSVTLESASKMPIPTPRKKVMFDFPMTTTKEEDSSYISDDDKKNGNKNF